MKLHLPSGLRKALLACIATIAAHSVPVTVATGAAYATSGALISFLLSQQAVAEEGDDDITSIVGDTWTWDSPGNVEWAENPNNGDVQNNGSFLLDENGQYYYKTRGGDNFQFGGGMNGSLRLHRMSQYTGAITTLKKKDGQGLQVSHLWLTGDATAQTDINVQSFKVTEAGYLTEHIQDIYINNVGLWVEANQENLQANFTLGSSYGTGIKFSNQNWLNGTLYFNNNAHIATSGKLIIAENTGIAFNQASTYFSVSELEGSGDLRIHAQNTGSYLLLTNGGSNYTGKLNFTTTGADKLATIKLGDDSTLQTAGITGSNARFSVNAAESQATVKVIGTANSATNITMDSGITLSLAQGASQTFVDSSLNGTVSLVSGSTLTLSGSSSVNSLVMNGGTLTSGDTISLSRLSGSAGSLAGGGSFAISTIDLTDPLTLGVEYGTRIFDLASLTGDGMLTINISDWSAAENDVYDLFAFSSGGSFDATWWNLINVAVVGLGDGLKLVKLDNGSIRIVSADYDEGFVWSGSDDSNGNLTWGKSDWNGAGTYQNDGTENVSFAGSQNATVTLSGDEDVVRANDMSLNAAGYTFVGDDHSLQVAHLLFTDNDATVNFQVDVEVMNSLSGTGTISMTGHTLTLAGANAQSGAVSVILMDSAASLSVGGETLLAGLTAWTGADSTVSLGGDLILGALSIQSGAHLTFTRSTGLARAVAEDTVWVDFGDGITSAKLADLTFEAGTGLRKSGSAQTTFVVDGAESLDMPIMVVGGTLMIDGLGRNVAGGPDHIEVNGDIVVNSGTLLFDGGNGGADYTFNSAITVEAGAELKTSSDILTLKAGATVNGILSVDWDGVFKLEDDITFTSTASVSVGGYQVVKAIQKGDVDKDVFVMFDMHGRTTGNTHDDNYPALTAAQLNALLPTNWASDDIGLGITGNISVAINGTGGTINRSLKIAQGSTLFIWQGENWNLAGKLAGEGTLVVQTEIESLDSNKWIKLSQGGSIGTLRFNTWGGGLILGDDLVVGALAADTDPNGSRRFVIKSADDADASLILDLSSDAEAKKVEFLKGLTIVKKGTATQTLENATIDADVQIDAGTLSLTGASTSASGDIRVNSGTLSVAGNVDISGSTLIVNGGSLTLNHGTNLGSLTLNAASGNKLTIQSAITINGSLKIAEGLTLQFDTGNADANQGWTIEGKLSGEGSLHVCDRDMILRQGGSIGVLANAWDATIHLGDVLTIKGAKDNLSNTNGTFTALEGKTASLIFDTSSSAIDVSSYNWKYSGIGLGVKGGNTLTMNAGTFTTISVEGGSTLALSGALDADSLEFGTGGGTVSLGDLTLTVGSITGDGTITLTDGGTIANLTSVNGLLSIELSGFDVDTLIGDGYQLFTNSSLDFESWSDYLTITITGIVDIDNYTIALEDGYIKLVASESPSVLHWVGKDGKWDDDGTEDWASSKGGDASYSYSWATDREKMMVFDANESQQTIELGAYIEVGGLTVQGNYLFETDGTLIIGKQGLTISSGATLELHGNSNMDALSVSGDLNLSGTLVLDGLNASSVENVILGANATLTLNDLKFIGEEGEGDSPFTLKGLDLGGYTLTVTGNSSVSHNEAITLTDGTLSLGASGAGASLQWKGALTLNGTSALQVWNGSSVAGAITLGGGSVTLYDTASIGSVSGSGTINVNSGTSVATIAGGSLTGTLAFASWGGSLKLTNNLSVSRLTSAVSAASDKALISADKAITLTVTGDGMTDVTNKYTTIESNVTLVIETGASQKFDFGTLKGAVQVKQGGLLNMGEQGTISGALSGDGALFMACTNGQDGLTISGGGSIGQLLLANWVTNKLIITDNEFTFGSLAVRSSNGIVESGSYNFNVQINDSGALVFNSSLWDNMAASIVTTAISGNGGSVVFDSKSTDWTLGENTKVNFTKTNLTMEKKGSSTLTMDAAVATGWGGGVKLTDGTLKLTSGNDTALSIIGNGGSLTLWSGSFSFTSLTGTFGAITLNTGVNISGDFTVTDGNTLTASGSNTFSGHVTIADGGAMATSNGPNAPGTFEDGLTVDGTLTIKGKTIVSNLLGSGLIKADQTTGRALHVSAGNYSGTFQDVDLTKIDEGTLTLSAESLGLRSIVVNAGTLALASGAGTTNGITVNGGTLSLEGNNTLGNVTINGGTLAVGGSISLTTLTLGENGGTLAVGELDSLNALISGNSTSALSGILSLDVSAWEGFADLFSGDDTELTFALFTGFASYDSLDLSIDGWDDLGFGDDGWTYTINDEGKLVFTKEQQSQGELEWTDDNSDGGTSLVWREGPDGWNGNTFFENEGADSVSFSKTGGGTVNMEGNLIVDEMSVHGGTYTFQKNDGYNDSTSLSVDSLSMEGAPDLTFKVDLTVNESLSGGGSISMEEGASLTLGAGVSEVSSALSFSGGEFATSGNVTLSGGIAASAATTVNMGGNLTLALTSDTDLSNFSFVNAKPSTFAIGDASDPTTWVEFEVNSDVERTVGQLGNYGEGTGMKKIGASNLTITSGTMGFDTWVSAGTLTLASGVSATGDITVTGATLVLNGNTLGDVTFEGGTLTLGNTASTFENLTISSALTNTRGNTPWGKVMVDGTLTIGQGASMFVNGSIGELAGDGYYYFNESTTIGGGSIGRFYFMWANAHLTLTGDLEVTEKLGSYSAGRHNLLSTNNSHLILSASQYAGKASYAEFLAVYTDSDQKNASQEGNGAYVNDTATTFTAGIGLGGGLSSTFTENNTTWNHSFIITSGATLTVNGTGFAMGSGQTLTVGNATGAAGTLNLNTTLDLTGGGSLVVNTNGKVNVNTGGTLKLGAATLGGTITLAGGTLETTGGLSLNKLALSGSGTSTLTIGLTGDITPIHLAAFDANGLTLTLNLKDLTTTHDNLQLFDASTWALLQDHITYQWSNSLIADVLIDANGYLHLTLAEPNYAPEHSTLVWDGKSGASTVGDGIWGAEDADEEWYVQGSPEEHFVYANGRSYSVVFAEAGDDTITDITVQGAVSVENMDVEDNYTFTVSNAIASSSLEVAGTLTLAGGKTATISGNSTLDIGTLAGAGKLDLQGMATTITAGLSFAGEIAVTGGSLSLGSGFTAGADSSITVTNASLTLNGNTLGSVTINSGTTISGLGGSTFSNLTLNTALPDNTSLGNVTVTGEFAVNYNGYFWGSNVQVGSLSSNTTGKLRFANLTVNNGGSINLLDMMYAGASITIGADLEVATIYGQWDGSGDNHQRISVSPNAAGPVHLILTSLTLGDGTQGSAASYSAFLNLYKYRRNAQNSKGTRDSVDVESGIGFSGLDLTFSVGSATAAAETWSNDFIVKGSATAAGSLTINGAVDGASFGMASGKTLTVGAYGSLTLNTKLDLSSGGSLVVKSGGSLTLGATGEIVLGSDTLSIDAFTAQQGALLSGFSLELGMDALIAFGSSVSGALTLDLTGLELAQGTYTLFTGAALNGLNISFKENSYDDSRWGLTYENGVLSIRDLNTVTRYWSTTADGTWSMEGTNDWAEADGGTGEFGFANGSDVVFGVNGAEKNVTLSGAISVGDMTVEDNYTFTTAGNTDTLTVTGSLTISEGKTATFNGDGTVTLYGLAESGALAIDGAAVTFGNSIRSFGAVTLTSGSLAINSDVQLTTLSGGTGTLTLGTHTLTVADALDFSGALTLSSGTLALTNGGSIGGLTMNGSLSLGASLVLNTLGGSGSVISSTAGDTISLTVNGSAASTLSSAITIGSATNTINITHSGGGTLTFGGSGSVIYGDVLNTAGKLAFNGSTTIYGNLSNTANTRLDLTGTGAVYTIGGQLNFTGTSEWVYLQNGADLTIQGANGSAGNVSRMGITTTGSIIRLGADFTIGTLQLDGKIGDGNSVALDVRLWEETAVDHITLTISSFNGDCATRFANNNQTFGAGVDVVLGVNITGISQTHSYGGDLTAAAMGITTGTVTVAGDAEFSGNLTVDGAGSLTVEGDMSVDGTFSVAGAANAADNFYHLNVDGDLTVEGNSFNVGGGSKKSYVRVGGDLSVENAAMNIGINSGSTSHLTIGGNLDVGSGSNSVWGAYSICLGHGNGATDWMTIGGYLNAASMVLVHGSAELTVDGLATIGGKLFFRDQGASTVTFKQGGSVAGLQFTANHNATIVLGDDLEISGTVTLAGTGSQINRLENVEETVYVIFNIGDDNASKTVAEIGLSGVTLGTGVELAKKGTGTLTITGEGTISTGFRVKEGNVSFATDGSVRMNGALTIDTGSGVTMSGEQEISIYALNGSGGSLTVSDGSTLVLSGASGSLTCLTLSGATVQIGSNSGANSLSLTQLTLSGENTLMIDSTGLSLDTALFNITNSSLAGTLTLDITDWDFSLALSGETSTFELFSGITDWTGLTVDITGFDEELWTVEFSDGRLTITRAEGLPDIFEWNSTADSLTWGGDEETEDMWRDTSHAWKNGANVLFDGASAGADAITVTLGEDITVNNMTVAAGGTYEFVAGEGSSLTVNRMLTVDGEDTSVTIGSGVSLTLTQATVNGSLQVTDSVEVEKSLTLGGTGSITLSGGLAGEGSVLIGTGASDALSVSLAKSYSGSITVGAGSTLKTTTADATLASLTLYGTGGGATVEVGAASLTVTSLTLNDADGSYTFSKGADVQSATLTVGNAQTVSGGLLAFSDLSVEFGGALTVSNAGQLRVGKNLTVNEAALTVSGNSTVTIGGNAVFGITGNTKIDDASTINGSVTINGTSMVKGILQLQSGSLTLGGNMSVDLLQMGRNAVTITSTAEEAITITISGNGGWNLGAKASKESGNYQGSMVIGDEDHRINIETTGTGQKGFHSVTLWGDMTIGDVLRIEEGTTTIHGALNASGKTVRVNDANGIFTVTDGATIGTLEVANAGLNLTLGGTSTISNITGNNSFALTVSAGGSLNIANTNGNKTLTGLTLGGTLKMGVGSGQTLNKLTLGALTLNNGATLDITGLSKDAALFALGTGFTLTNSITEGRLSINLANWSGLSDLIDGTSDITYALFDASALTDYDWSAWNGLISISGFSKTDWSVAFVDGNLVFTYATTQTPVIPEDLYWVGNTNWSATDTDTDWTDETGDAGQFTFVNDGAHNVHFAGSGSTDITVDGAISVANMTVEDTYTFNAAESGENSISVSENLSVTGNATFGVNTMVTGNATIATATVNGGKTLSVGGAFEAENVTLTSSEWNQDTSTRLELAAGGEITGTLNITHSLIRLGGALNIGTLTQGGRAVFEMIDDTNEALVTIGTYGTMDRSIEAHNGVSLRFTNAVGTSTGAFLGSLLVNKGNATFDSDWYLEVTQNNNIDIQGDLSVGGVFHMSTRSVGTFNVSGDAEISDDATFADSAAMTIGGTLTAGANMTLSAGNLTVGAVSVTGETTVSAGTMTVNGDADFTGAVTVSGTLTVNQKLDDSAAVVNTVDFSSNVTVGSDAAKSTAQLTIGDGVATSLADSMTLAVYDGAAATIGGTLSAGKATVSLSGEGSSLDLKAGGSIGTLQGAGGTLSLGSGTLSVTYATGSLTKLSLGGTLSLGSNSGANQLTLGTLELAADATLSISDLSEDKALFNLSSFTNLDSCKLSLDLSNWEDELLSSLKGTKDITFALFSGLSDWADLEDALNFVWENDGWEASFVEGNLVFHNTGNGLYWTDENDGKWSANSQFAGSDNGNAENDFGDESSVVFGESPTIKDVTLEGDITVGKMTVYDDYTFTTDEDSSLKAGELHIAYEKSATFAGDGSEDAGKNVVNISKVTGEGTLVVETENGSGLTLTLGDKAKDSFHGNVTLNSGTLTLADGLTLAGSTDAAKAEVTGKLTLNNGELKVDASDVSAKVIDVTGEVTVSGDSTEVVLKATGKITGNGTLTNATASAEKTLSGDASEFTGTIAAADEDSSWKLTGDLDATAELGMSLTGDGKVSVEYETTADALAITGKLTGELDIENAMKGTTLILANGEDTPQKASYSAVRKSAVMPLANTPDEASGKLIFNDNAIQLGSAEKAGVWGGNTLEGKGTFTLVNGTLKQALTNLDDVTVKVDAQGAVNAGGTAASNLSDIVIHGEQGGSLSNVDGGITAGGADGLRVRLSLGESNIGSVDTVGTGDYLIKDSGDLTVAAFGDEGFGIDLTSDALMSILMAHSDEGVKSALHIVSGGSLLAGDGINLQDVMAETASRGWGLLSSLGFDVDVQGGDIMLVGSSQDVYIVTKDGDMDAEVDDWTEGLGGYSATLVGDDADLTLHVNTQSDADFAYTWDGEKWTDSNDVSVDESVVKASVTPALNDKQLEGLKNDQLNGGRTVNNLLGGKGSTLTVKSDDKGGFTGTGEDNVTFVNTEDTEFEGTIIVENSAEVDFVKKGTGTLTVGSEKGEGGIQAADSSLTLEDGSLTVQGGDNNKLGSLVFNDGESKGGFTFTKGSKTTMGSKTTVGSIEETDGDGGNITIEKEAQLVLTGKSTLSDTLFGGDGSGSLSVRDGGSLSMAGSDSGIADVNVDVTEGSLELSGGATITGDEIDITVSGKKSSMTVNGGSSLSTGGTLTVDDGGLLDLTSSTGNTVGQLLGKGSLNANGGDLTITGTGSSFGGVLGGGSGGTLIVESGADLTLDNVGTSVNSKWSASVKPNGSLTVDVTGGAKVDMDDITLSGDSKLTVVCDPQKNGQLNSNLTVDRQDGQGKAALVLDVEGIGGHNGTLNFGSLVYDGNMDDLAFSLEGTGAQHYNGTLARRSDNTLYVGMEKVNTNLYLKAGMEKNVAAGARILWDLTDPDSAAYAYAFGSGKGGDLGRVASATALLTAFGQDLSKGFAAVAGSSVSTLSGALDSDLQRQLNAIRNRTVTMNDTAALSAESPTMHAWVNAENNYHKVDADGFAPGYTLNGWGGTVGFGVELDEETCVGLALSAMYNDLKTDSADNGRGDMDTTWLSAFARVQSSEWSHTFVASVGVADVKLNRSVDLGMGAAYSTRGETHGYGIGLMYEVGYAMVMDEQASFVVQPIANVQFRHESISGYSESLSDAGLRVDDMTRNTVTFGVGVRMQHAVSEHAFGRLSYLEARALVKVDAGDNRGYATNALLHGNLSQEVESAAVGRTALELGAGLTVPVDESSSIFVDAAVELRDGASSLNASAGYKVTF